MKIIYFSPHPTHDIVSDVGYSTHQREMIGALRQLGHEVVPVIIGGAEKSDLPKATINQQPSGFVSILKKFVPPILWRTLKDFKLMRHDTNIAGPRLRQAVKEHHPDLIYERSEYLLKQGSVVAKEFGIKHIYEVNAPCVEEWLELEGASLLTQSAIKVEVAKMRLSTGFCPVSSPLGKFLERTYGIAEKRIEVIPNAINLDRVQIELESTSTRDRLGIKKTDVVVGFIGAILPYHGVDLLLEAFEKASKQDINLKLLIVGDGEMLQQLKVYSKRNSLDDRVIFTGRVPHSQVWEHIDAMDICVNPKHSWYGSPIKTFEYGALSKAIIAPDDGNMRDVLTHNETAILYDGSVGELCKQMLNLGSNESLRKSIGMTLGEKIKHEHVWTKNAQRMIEFAKRL